MTAYVQARAADADGAVDAAARGYAEALAARPDDAVIAIRALREGLASGDLTLARRAGNVLRAADVSPPDIELLAFADALVAKDVAGQQAALERLKGTPIAFLGPMMAAWTDRTAVATEPGAGGAIARRYAAENRVLLLLADRKTPEGIAALRTLLDINGGNLDLRMNAAQLLARGGDRRTAHAVLAGDDPVLMRAAATLGRGRPGDARFGVSRLFARMAADLSADGTEPLAILLTRAALVLDPGYARARLALADALTRDGASAAALTVLAAIPARDPFAPGAAALRVTVLHRAGDIMQATALARSRADARNADSGAIADYAGLLVDSGRHAGAAAAYGRAIDRAGPAASWVLHLQHGGALDRAGQWDAALPELRRAVELAPDQPAALNYLGYAQVERGLNLTEATALIERAHKLAPDDASIVDSLGWARFRQGDLAGALMLVERAARAEPDDPEINEHLGDIYWQAGRRFEARYAWHAAANAATGTAAARIATKLATGTASPQG